jgi:lactate permease
LHDLSADVGRVCAPVSLILPAYLIIVMGGWRALKGVLPAALLCGAAFATSQFLVSSYLGPYLTDIIGSLASMGVLIVLLQFWKPVQLQANSDVLPRRHPTNEVILAWAPYGLLVLFVLLWGWTDVKVLLNKVTQQVGWPGLHGMIQKMPPVVGKPTGYDAFYKLDYLAASGTACMLASFASAAVLRVSFSRFLGIFTATIRQLALSLLTIATVVGLAFLMNYCGATVTLGLAFAATGAAFPFFSSLLGWLGVFLTGSDTSANALFGNLQVITANTLGLKPALMAASNSSGGVMGKMISLQSIAVACAATGMSTDEESKLFRFTLRHSLLLATIIGLIVLFYSYVAPGAAW